MKTLHSTKRILCGLTLAAAGALAMLSTGAQAEPNDTLAKIKQSGVISVGLAFGIRSLPGRLPEDT